MYDDNSTQQIKTGLAFLLGKWMKYFSEGQPDAIETIRYLVLKNQNAGTMDAVENIESGAGFYISSQDNKPVMPDEVHLFTSFNYAIAYWTGLGKPETTMFSITYCKQFIERLKRELEISENLGNMSFKSEASENLKPSVFLINDILVNSFPPED